MPGRRLAPSFGSPAVRRCCLTRGFAAPSHDGCALIGRGLSLWGSSSARGVPSRRSCRAWVPQNLEIAGPRGDVRGPIGVSARTGRPTPAVMSDGTRAHSGTAVLKNSIFICNLRLFPASGRTTCFCFPVCQPMEWLTMTARERVAAFLLAHQPRRLCDECLAHELGIDPSTAYRAAVKAGRSGGFIREYGVCSDCGESRLVTCASR